MHVNPILKTDIPDPDVIRVGDTYYMISTTMYFMPGAVILRSFDLIQWEIYTHVYETLDDTPAQKMEDGLNIYGKGMWAASLRHHDGMFYVCFVANDTQKTYLFRAKDIKGPWKKSYIDGFYHDNSLLFDDDGKTYIVYGNSDIYLTELNDDLTGPRKNGLHRVIIKEKQNVVLGYEGAHFYRINGRYYVFLIHWLKDGTKRRVQACFSADSLQGDFEGRDVLNDDLDFFNNGVAQGGIVDTPDGEWYAVLFQDHGAVGRIPVVVPVAWENGFPVFGVNGKVPKDIRIKSTRPDHVYELIVSSDDFRYRPGKDGKVRLDKVWQWNHSPDNSLWSVDGEKGILSLSAGRPVENVTRAKNVLTRLTVTPGCEAAVYVDGSLLNSGDYAGICALQGRYGMIALHRRDDEYFVVMKGRPGKPEFPVDPAPYKDPGVEYERIPLNGDTARLKVKLNYESLTDEAEFFHYISGRWERAGIRQKLYYHLDHFTGCRIGLFVYSTEEPGGTAMFAEFEYKAHGILKTGYNMSKGRTE